jgi:hypothetical protein
MSGKLQPLGHSLLHTSSGTGNCSASGDGGDCVVVHGCCCCSFAMMTPRFDTSVPATKPKMNPLSPRQDHSARCIRRSGLMARPPALLFLWIGESRLTQSRSAAPSDTTTSRARGPFVIGPRPRSSALLRALRWSDGSSWLRFCYFWLWLGDGALACGPSSTCWCWGAYLGSKRRCAGSTPHENLTAGRNDWWCVRAPVLYVERTFA